MRTTSLTLASAMAAAVSITASAASIGSDSAAGIWLGEETLNVSPFMSLSYVRDNNPNSLRSYSKARARSRGMSEQTESANAFVIKGGLNFLMPGNHWSLTGRAYVNYETYSGADVDDRFDIYEIFTLKGWTDAGTSWYLTESYQDISYDDDYQLTQDDRKTVAVGGGVEAAATDKSKVIVGAGYSLLDYEDKANSDYATISGKLGFAHELTDKTDWTLAAGYKNYDRDGYDCNAWSVDGRVGLRTRSTDKLTFDTSIGAEFFRDYKYDMFAADGTYLGRKSKGEDETSLVYGIGASWKMAERLSLRVNGDAGYKPSSDINDNSYLEDSIGATLTYTPGDHWKLAAGATYERDDFNRHVVDPMTTIVKPYSSVDQGGKKRTDDVMRYFASISYSLTRYCAIFANCRYTDTNSSVSGYDYERTRYGAGISLKY